MTRLFYEYKADVLKIMHFCVTWQFEVQVMIISAVDISIF